MGERSLRMDVLSIYVPSFFIFLGMSIVSPILPLYAKSFNVSYTMVSLAISAYAFGRFIADVPVGMLADRWGRRPLMIWGTVLLTVTAFLNALARNFPEFLFFRLVQGIGSAMWMTSRTTLLADILKPEKRGRVMSYFQAFMLLGSSAGPTIGGYVATMWGVKETFYFYGLTGLISLVITYFLIKEPEGLSHHGKHTRFDMPTMKRLLSNRSFSLACLATFTVFFMRTGIRGTMIPLYADAVLGLDEVTIGTVISYATIMNLIMTIPMGHAIDYFGRKPPMVFTLFITAFAALAFPYTTDYLTISLAAVLLGIGTGGAGQAPLALATDATMDEPHGLSMGMYRLFGDIGFVVGPIILGLIADNYGLRMPFFFMTGMILVSTVLVQLYAKETYRMRDHEKKTEQV
ncbi:MFS transporter [Candidatus Bathyarchaeota archaeon]|nr:MFS transporter [Candidatus Bathyarchaeota archaeon]